MKEQKYKRLTGMLARMSDAQVDNEAAEAWERFARGEKPSAEDFVIMHTWGMRLWAMQKYGKKKEKKK